jgi:MFS family permease
MSKAGAPIAQPPGSPGSREGGNDSQRRDDLEQVADSASYRPETVSHDGVDSAHAWMIAATAFFTCFVVYGVQYSFGAFFKSIAADMGAGRADTAAIFSVNMFVSNLFGVVSGYLADRFGPRPLVAAAALTAGLGLVLTSRIDHLWMGYLTYGVGIGIASGCSFIPMVAVVSGWFERRRNAAIGLTVSGIGCGTLFMVPLIGVLIHRYGWRTSYLTLGVVSAALLALCAMIIERPPMPQMRTRPRLGDVARTPAFIVLCLANTLSNVGTFIPFVYLPDFAQTRHVSTVAAASLLGVIGGASVIGRLGLGGASDRFGVMALYKLTLLMIGVSYALWFAPASYAALVTFAVILGIGYGGSVALSPAVVVELFGVHGLGAMLGVIYGGSAFTSLAWPPLAGFIVDRTGSYSGVALLGGGCGLLAFGSLYPLAHHAMPSRRAAS